MNVIPLAQYLSEFDDDGFMPLRPQRADRATGHPQPDFARLSTDHAPGMDEEREAEAFAGAIVEADALPEAEPAPDLSERIEAAAALAREEAREETRRAVAAEMEALFAERLREERERSEQARTDAVEAARAEWVEAESGRLAEMIGARLDRMEMAIRTSVKSVLRPIAMNARQEQTLHQLADSVQTMMLDGKAFSIRATGPDDLLTAFAAKLGSRRALVTIEPDDALGELRIEADKTVIETRLSGWRHALEEVLA